MAATMPVQQFSGLCSNHTSKKQPAIVLKPFRAGKFASSIMPARWGGHLCKRTEARVISPEIFQWSTYSEILDSSDDEYSGVIIDSESLPSNADAFASAVQASLSYWKLKGKKGVWLKISLEKAEFVSVAIQVGFDFHHAEAGYVMLTHWISNEPCLLPSSPSHHIGVGGFVINDKNEVLVVKEKCPCSCSDVWKMPTGYLNKSEDIFCGAAREVKEETGVETMFLEMVAFRLRLPHTEEGIRLFVPYPRHAHHLAFEKSDLLFICMLKPLTAEITIDEKEIQAAKWMPLDEFASQPFYEEDEMSRKMIDICTAAHAKSYSGFNGRLMRSKLDGKPSYLYYDETRYI